MSAVGNTPQTHCKRGHEMTPENVIVKGRARIRACKACARAREQRYRRERGKRPPGKRFCVRGHDLTQPGARGHRGRCVVCHRERERRRHAGVEGGEYIAALVGDPCSYCGAACEQIDHIDPLVEGGAAEWGNLTAACRRCNRAKSDRPLLGFLLVK